MAEFIIDILKDTVLDLLKTVPFLFVIYFLLEWMESETGHRMERFLEKHRRINPLAGTLFGMLPSCGFANAASSMYATGVISAGTLVAVVLLVKLCVGLIAGYACDILSRHRTINVNEFCEREHDDHSHGILHSACMHTIQVSLWLFVTIFIFNGLVGLVGEDVIRAFITSHASQSVLICSLLGLVPSCASSIILSTMYIDRVISFSAACAGLLVNAGTGMIMLYRVNPNWKDNLKITFTTFLFGLAAGLILRFAGL